MGSFNIEEIVTSTWKLTHFKTLKPKQSFLWENDLHFLVEDKEKREDSEFTMLKLYKKQIEELVRFLQLEKKKHIRGEKNNNNSFVAALQTGANIRLLY